LCWYRWKAAIPPRRQSPALQTEKTIKPADLHIVTGGAGFIGSNIARALVARGDDVIVVDTTEGEKTRNLAGLRLTDILPLSSPLESVRAKVASVIHMGAISSTTETDLDRLQETNFQYPCQLWDWCTRNRVPFVYASSAATYGDGNAGFEDRDDPDYLEKLRPLNPYGASKHQFDRWACKQAAEGNAPPHWAGLKFFNVYGPNEFHKGAQRSVALQLFQQILRGEPVRLFASENPRYPDGGQMRDFVWVGDCVRIALWFSDGLRDSGLYNAGSGTARSFADLALAVYAAMGVTPDIRFIPMPEVQKGKYQYFTQGPMAKIAAAGYRELPTGLEDGVMRYVKELCDHSRP
jgi:ADP-L-glycero-D-manno-heptose 6-epimerase